ncbi:MULTISPECIES: hypothetical protein [unclassified Moorena]|uniref:hypothetical protein n=1 Tax=unclassified Moorena TaxID=2683338 RepID=UPI0014003AD1|nr:MULTISPECIES: hypothetical protein [unclassified Moorena]NEO12971.1 hypothetical protein [Moorena sp. SIO3E8]NEP99859.1 hypothetical protein [Moorena sp. SIO3F7]
MSISKRSLCKHSAISDCATRTLREQRSVISYQLSVISYQRSAISATDGAT